MPEGTPAPLEDMAASVRNQVNALRAGQGLDALATDPRLDRLATDYSCRMAREGFFSHTDPDGNAVDVRMMDASISYVLVGENLARNENAGEPVETAVEGWEDSPAHAENMFREEFTHTGVGVCGDGVEYHFTQVFMRPPD